MDSIIGSMVFEFIGACIKWVLNLIYAFIKGNERPKFGEIYGGKEGSEYHEILLNGVSNIFIGLGFTFVIIFILIFLEL